MNKPVVTIDDLFQFDGKAELMNGEIVQMPPTGYLPGIAGAEIYVSLRTYVKRVKRGIALPDNQAFKVNLPSRGSFSPNAAYFTGAPPHTKMKFLDGAPAFAAEVRSEGDYGPAAERLMAVKRAEYFAAGTLVVWDVDMLSKDVVRSYDASAPDAPVIYRRGDIAQAEPAVPGWTMAVDDLFPD